jgi:hypothetical protein
MTQALPTDLANVSHPAGVMYVAEWDEDVSDSRRYFRGSTRVVDRADDPYGDDIGVEIYRRQGAAGDITRHIMVMEGSAEYIDLNSSAHARQFAQALLAAADEWDQMSAHDQVVVR